MVEIMICCLLQKRLRFEHTTKKYIHYPEFAQENGANKIQWNLEK